MIRIGVVGYGYWGPGIVRNFHGIPGAEVAIVCDKSRDSLRRAREAHPDVAVTSEYSELLTATDIDAIAIVTPVWTHFELARAALCSGKHVFVEKPFTANVVQALELIELAERKRLQIMVDHTFLFTGAVRKIRELIDEDKLGSLYYYDSTRVNLGLFQHDVNVVWDLAPHDISIVDHIVKDTPEVVVATGQRHLNGFEDVAYITIYFTNSMIGHINVNWLSPVKVRTTLIGGEKKMLVWNDLDADEKIKVYDKGVEISNRENVHDLLVSYRAGDMWVPKIGQAEALKEEAKYFIDCISTNTKPFNDGAAGLRVVKVLEAADKSLKSGGRAVLI